MDKIKLNSRVKDKVSGFTGIVMARTEYLFGNSRIAVCQELLNTNGSLDDWRWFDESQLIVLLIN